MRAIAMTVSKTPTLADVAGVSAVSVALKQFAVAATPALQGMAEALRKAATSFGALIASPAGDRIRKNLRKLGKTLARDTRLAAIRGGNARQRRTARRAAERLALYEFLGRHAFEGYAEREMNWIWTGDGKTPPPRGLFSNAGRDCRCVYGGDHDLA